ncbi:MULTISPECIES: TniQ family protein [Paraburkholderia]
MAPPRETPPSFLMRTAIINGFTSVEGFVKSLGLRPIRSFFSVTNLNNLAAATEGVLGDAAEIRETRTPLPALMRLTMSREERDAVCALVSGEAGRCRALDYHRSRGAYLQTNVEGYYCPKCARYDFSVLGFSYRHVEHTFRDTYACSEHRCSLTTGCGTCPQSQSFRRGLRFPSVECSCGKAAVPLLAHDSPELQVHVRVASILTKCLERDMPYFADVCDIGSVFQRQVERLGMTRYGRLSRSLFRQKIYERYGSSVLHKFGLLTASGEISLVDYLRPNSRVLSAYNVAILIDFLFGSLEAFSRAVSTHRCPENRATNPRTGTTRRTGLGPPNTDRYVKQIDAYRAANPDATRSEILQRLSYAARSLQSTDPQAYEEAMPGSRRKVGARARHPARMAELDKALRAHVLERAGILDEDGGCGRCSLSARSLLLGHPAERSFYANREELPSTAQLIDELLDGDAHR